MKSKNYYLGFGIAMGACLGITMGVVVGVTFDALAFLGIVVGVGGTIGMGIGAALYRAKESKDDS